MTHLYDMMTMVLVAVAAEAAAKNAFFVTSTLIMATKLKRVF
jgi:hypothetical protein